MYGIKNLKQKIQKTDKTVECPIKDCHKKVQRQRSFFKKEKEFLCPIHTIYISPSTFEYESEHENILWNDPDDITIFNDIKKVKRESRIARDNSEDAVSWNVFRYLEKNNLLNKWVTDISGKRQHNSKLIYWSYSQDESWGWSGLNYARYEFGEDLNRSSEPDIIISTDSSIFFIEAKFGASNKTSGDAKAIRRRLANPKRYLTGGEKWFRKVFSSGYEKILRDQKYELMRFWLLGTWLARRYKKSFYLVNLVRDGREIEIEKEFGIHIKDGLPDTFKRITWEDIYNFIKNEKAGKGKRRIIEYFKNKTLGYDNNGCLIKAFNI